MKTFYCGPDPASGARIPLQGGELHHAVRVLRLQQDEPVRVLDGAGGVYLGRWESESRSVVVEKSFQAPAQRCHVTIGAALLKGDRWDWLIEKCVEIGVQRLVPLTTLHAVARLPEKEHLRKRERWIQIALSAMKQAGQPRLPQIDPPASLAEFCQSADRTGERWILSERGGAPVSTLLKPGISRIALLAGPEGGWALEELELVRQSGFAPVSLGTQVLRAETASIYALSAIRFVTERGGVPPG